MRERARVRGKYLIIRHFLPPHPAFGHLLPQREGISGESELIRKNVDAISQVHKSDVKTCAEDSTKYGGK